MVESWCPLSRFRTCHKKFAVARPVLCVAVVCCVLLALLTAWAEPNRWFLNIGVRTVNCQPFSGTNLDVLSFLIVLGYLINRQSKAVPLQQLTQRWLLSSWCKFNFFKLQRCGFSYSQQCFSTCLGRLHCVAGFWARVRGCSESSSWKHASQRWTATNGPARMQRMRLLHPSQDKFRVHGSLLSFFIRCNVRSKIVVGFCRYMLVSEIWKSGRRFFHKGPIRFCRRYGFAWAAAKVWAFRCYSSFCVLRGKVFRHFTKDSKILKERDRLGDNTCALNGPVNYMQRSYSTILKGPCRSLTCHQVRCLRLQIPEEAFCVL